MAFCWVIFIIIAGLFTTVSAGSPDNLRNYFEWGEYQQLIDTLEPVLAEAVPPCDSTDCARYHLYLGVAKYGTGHIGEAKKHFLRALQFDPRQRPDRRYISDEIDDLFSVTLSDYTEQRRRARENDSLLAERQRAFDANVRAIRREELRRSRLTGAMVSVSTAVIGIGFAGIAVYEYYSTRDPYADFRRAATGGDRTEYDRLQPIIRRANGVITGCAVSAGISELAALFFGIRNRNRSKDKQ